MVTNVSEKDKALQEVIDWCEPITSGTLGKCSKSHGRR